MIAEIETVTAVTAKNQFVEAANGVTYAYRQLGVAPDATPPLVLLQHFRGNLDNSDPLLIDNLAAQRSVVLVDKRRRTCHEVLSRSRSSPRSTASPGLSPLASS